MNRTWMALAVVGLAAAAGSAKADPGGYAPPGGPFAGYPGPTMAAESPPDNDTLIGKLKQKPDHPPDRFGLLPGLKKMFMRKKTCDTCEGKGGVGGHGSHGGEGAYAPPPPVNQGTLVFPHNPYVRSPRDWFMYEPAR